MATAVAEPVANENLCMSLQLVSQFADFQCTGGLRPDFTVTAVAHVNRVMAYGEWCVN
jgi:hypothetical protein